MNEIQEEVTPYGSPALVNAGLPPESRAELIEGTSWSKELSWQHIQTIAHYMGAYKIDNDAWVFHEGDNEPYMCLIVKGKIRILKEASDHTSKLVSIIGPGQTFGEMSLVDGEVRSASAIAAADSLVLILSIESFERMQVDHPKTAILLLLRIGRMMSRRLRMTTGMLVECFER